ncbi:MAG: hypothetical protein IAE93_05965 [Ignavibacteria bacterium]|nr:hypothetical protein [Ignavibacteria bacterium]
MIKDKFAPINPNNSLFQNLILDPPKWWDNLKRDEDIYIDIRKGNYINVYYNGGALMKLRFVNGKYDALISKKYVCLLDYSKDYVNYDVSKTEINFDFSKMKIINLNNFEKYPLKLLKSQIEMYYNNDSEKGIQANFVLNDGCFIDTEFEYSYDSPDKKESCTIRIDLVRIDIVSKKIVFFELKTIGDKRLYNNELTEQLRGYNEFITLHELDLLNYYNILFLIKKELGILPIGLKGLSSLSGFEILKKPILLFGNCQQKWIEDNSIDIDSKIKSFATGSFYFGSTKSKCDLNLKHKNRHIY